MGKNNNICHLDFPGKVFLIVSFLLTLQLPWLWSFCGTAKFLLVFGPLHSHLSYVDKISPQVSDSSSNLSLTVNPYPDLPGWSGPRLHYSVTSFPSEHSAQSNDIY